jgi:putative transcriptional regulator
MVENKLKVFRAMKDLTQEALADKVGVTRQTIIAIENNKYLPSLELAFKIADFFDVGLEEIFIYQGEQK